MVLLAINLISFCVNLTRFLCKLKKLSKTNKKNLSYRTLCYIILLVIITDLITMAVYNLKNIRITLDSMIILKIILCVYVYYISIINQMSLQRSTQEKQL